MERQAASRWGFALWSSTLKPGEVWKNLTGWELRLLLPACSPCPFSNSPWVLGKKVWYQPITAQISGPEDLCCTLNCDHFSLNTFDLAAELEKQTGGLKVVHP